MESYYEEGANIVSQEGYDTKSYAELKDEAMVIFAAVRNTKNGCNIQFVKEKNDNNFTAQDYIDSLKLLLSDLSSVKYEVEDTTTENIAGKTFNVLKASTSFNGITMKQTYYIRVLEDGSFFYVIVTDTTGSMNFSSMVKAY